MDQHLFDLLQYTLFMSHHKIDYLLRLQEIEWRLLAFDGVQEILHFIHGGEQILESQK